MNVRAVVPAHLYGIFPSAVMGMTLPTAIMDERGRIVLPKEVAEELGASAGDHIVIERRGDEFVVSKAEARSEELEEMMDWNPKRVGKVKRVSPREMKEIWKS